jgi:serine protease Do
VLALGNPFLLGVENEFFRPEQQMLRHPADFHPSVSFGVVSALYRNTPPRYPDAIQVDVAVNPGNSGGPLLTLDGKVVGINGKIETRFGISVNSGVGYAVPSSKIERFFDVLKEAGGKSVPAGQLFGLQVDERVSVSAPGLPITLVVQGSHAETAGFRKGDRIVSVDTYSVTTRSRLRGLLQSYPADSQVSFHLLREGNEVDIDTVLPRNLRDTKPKLGVNLRPASDSDPTLRVGDVEEGSPADRAGLEVGDLLLRFDGREVESIADVRIWLADKKLGDTVELGVRRGDRELDLSILLEPYESE